MSFATVMVHVETAPGTAPNSGARIRLAAGLAERFSSTLIGISAAVLPPYPAENMYYVTKEIVEQEQKDILAALKAAEAAFRTATDARAEPGALKVEWRSAINVPDSYIVSEARSADLLVVGQAREAVDIARSFDPGTAILKAGRPVLVTPPGIDALKGERVLVGWNDSREARRALSDALPLLEGAKSVAILEICEDGEESAAQHRVNDVAQYLGRHRISVGAATTAVASGSIAGQLINAASVEDADLIVTGGYGHTRLGEWIFGGVTRDLLKTSPVCCLFAN